MPPASNAQSLNATTNPNETTSVKESAELLVNGAAVLRPGQRGGEHGLHAGQAEVVGNGSLGPVFANIQWVV